MAVLLISQARGGPLINAGFMAEAYECLANTSPVVKHFVSGTAHEAARPAPIDCRRTLGQRDPVGCRLEPVQALDKGVVTGRVHATGGRDTVIVLNGFQIPRRRFVALLAEASSSRMRSVLTNAESPLRGVFRASFLESHGYTSARTQSSFSMREPSSLSEARTGARGSIDVSRTLQIGDKRGQALGQLRARRGPDLCAHETCSFTVRIPAFLPSSSSVGGAPCVGGRSAWRSDGFATVGPRRNEDSDAGSAVAAVARDRTLPPRGETALDVAIGSRRKDRHENGDAKDANAPSVSVVVIDRASVRNIFLRL
ncbi:hypothetical protein CDD83_9348 [Cordyceps sp. RAO-2017]|nr:hypothetical protein CDD83_9348 [Cordyceps sp. RAO-2017]